jgi:hypothetical protein
MTQNLFLYGPMSNLLQPLNVLRISDLKHKKINKRSQIRCIYFETYYSIIQINNLLKLTYNTINGKSFIEWYFFDNSIYKRIIVVCTVLYCHKY